MSSSNNSIFILLMLVTTTTSVFGGKQKVIHVNAEDYHICHPLAVRPHHTTVVPSRSIEVSGETVVVTHYHVIPYSTLSTFFNEVLREDPLRNELGSYLARCIRSIYDFIEAHDDIRVFLPGKEPSLLHSDRPITLAGRSATFSVDNKMLAAFTWIPGNIFYGPPANRRAHDPGDNIEEVAERIVGIQAFAILRRIYSNMQNYINNPSERTTTHFNAILNDLSDVAVQRNTPYDYHQSDWVAAGWNNAGQKMFDIKKHSEVIEEVTDGYDHELKNRSAAGDVGTFEDYIKAADRVCKEYLKHLIPKFNTSATHVDIDYDVVPLFVYSINKKHFVYGQNKRTKRWFIKHVEDDGKVGTLTDQGSWQNYYAVQLTFEINGQHYLYGHNLHTYYWFIQELKAGVMGRETANGYFKDDYFTQFHICINDQHYLYGQNEQYNKWFLQKLNSDGSMGIEVSHGEWINSYDIQFPFKIGDRQYFGGHNTDSKQYFIRDIDADNLQSMGKPNIWTKLDHSYSVLFPFSFGGKTYLFGHNPVTKYWTVRQIFGDILDHNYMNYQFIKAQPFNINGYHYFYASLKGNSGWCLLYFDFKYL